MGSFISPDLTPPAVAAAFTGTSPSLGAGRREGAPPPPSRAKLLTRHGTTDRGTTDRLRPHRAVMIELGDEDKPGKDMLDRRANGRALCIGLGDAAAKRGGLLALVDVVPEHAPRGEGAILCRPAGGIGPDARAGVGLADQIRQLGTVTGAGVAAISGSGSAPAHGRYPCGSCNRTSGWRDRPV